MKKNWKTLVGLSIAGVMALGLAACGGGSSAASSAASSAPAEAAASSAAEEAAPAEEAASAASSAAEEAAPAENKDAEVIQCRIGAGHTWEMSWTQGIPEGFMPYVDEKLAETGNYKMEWIDCSGGTVAPLDEMLEAIQDDLIDVGNVTIVFEAAKLPLMNLHYYLPFTTDDVMAEARAADKLYEKYPEILGQFQDYNQTALGMAVMSTYDLFTNFECAGPEDLNGHKIGAAGANLAWMEGTGAVGVQSGAPDAYQSIQTGVYDGCIQPMDSMYKNQVYEVAKYMLNIPLGSLWDGCLTVNNDYFNSLPEEVQQAFIEGGQVYADKCNEIAQSNTDEAMKGFADQGVKITEMTPEARAAWANSIANLPQEYIETLKNDYGIENGKEMYADFISFLEEEGVEMPRDWLNE